MGCIRNILKKGGRSLLLSQTKGVGVTVIRTIPLFTGGFYRFRIVDLGHLYNPLCRFSLIQTSSRLKFYPEKRRNRSTRVTLVFAGSYTFSLRRLLS